MAQVVNCIYSREKGGRGKEEEGHAEGRLTGVGCTGMLSEIYNVYKPEIWQVREGARDFLEDQEYFIKHTY